MTADSAEPSARRRGAFLAVGIVLVTVAAYLPLREASFVLDDHQAVEHNEVVARGDVAEIFRSPYWAGTNLDDDTLYRPLTVLSFAVDRKLAGRPSPLLSHAINLMLHLAATILVILFARRIGIDRYASMVAAALFAVHPIHVEAVANVVGRAEILATLCCLAAFTVILGPKHRASASFPSRWRCWIAGVLLLAGLCSKETAVAGLVLLPWMLLLLVHAPQRTGRWLTAMLWTLTPTILAAVVYVVMRGIALEQLLATQVPHPLDNPLVLLDGDQRVATALGLVTRAAGLLLYPMSLSIDYSGHVIPAETSFWSWRPMVGAGLLLLSLFVILRPLAGTVTRRAAMFADGRLQVQLSLATAVFLAPYLVTGNLIVAVGTIFGERLLYFPSIGACLLLGLALSWLTGYAMVERLRGFGAGPAALLVIPLILVVAFSLLTWQRSREWRDDATVFRAAVREKPASPRAQFMLGKVLLEQGDATAAAAAFDRALEAWPDYLVAHIERGVLHARAGDLAAAERNFREAIRINPQDATALYNLSLALQLQGRAGAALRAARRATAANPSHAGAWAQVGRLEQAAGRDGAALSAYRRAIALGRSDLVPLVRQLDTGSVAPEGAAPGR